MKFDVETLQRAISQVSAAKSTLSNCRTQISGITIPGDFPESGKIKAAVGKISTIEGMLSNVQSSILKSIYTFYEATKNNNYLINQLFGILNIYGKGIDQDKLRRMKEIFSLTNPGNGTGSLNSNGQKMYQQDTFLETISKCWKKLYENGKNIKYGAAENGVPLDWSAENWKPTSQGSADCSSFVSWTLYEYGYSEFGNGEQHYTWDFTNQANLDRWQSEYGWKVDRAENGGEAAEKVKDGDIVVFDGPESNPNDGHMFIVSKVKEDGEIVTYDAGDQSHWTNLDTQKELSQNNINISGYTGSEEGTTSGYFSSDNPNYNRECTIITIEDVSWDDIEFVNTSM